MKNLKWRIYEWAEQRTANISTSKSFKKSTIVLYLFLWPYFICGQFCVGYCDVRAFVIVNVCDQANFGVERNHLLRSMENSAWNLNIKVDSSQRSDKTWLIQIKEIGEKKSTETINSAYTRLIFRIQFGPCAYNICSVWCVSIEVNLVMYTKCIRRILNSKFEIIWLWGILSRRKNGGHSNRLFCIQHKKCICIVCCLEWNNACRYTIYILHMRRGVLHLLLRVDVCVRVCLWYWEWKKWKRFFA